MVFAPAPTNAHRMGSGRTRGYSALVTNRASETTPPRG